MRLVFVVFRYSKKTHQELIIYCRCIFLSEFRVMFLVPKTKGATLDGVDKCFATRVGSMRPTASLCAGACTRLSCSALPVLKTRYRIRVNQRVDTIHYRDYKTTMGTV